LLCKELGKVAVVEYLHFTSKYTSLLDTLPWRFEARQKYWPCEDLEMPWRTRVWLEMMMPREECNCLSWEEITNVFQLLLLVRYVI